MKLKYKNLRILTLVAFLIVGFFEFGVAQKVQAACTYSIQFGGDKNFVTLSDTINFTAVVTRSDLQGCFNQVYVQMQLTTKTGTKVINSGSDFVSFSGVGLTTNYAFSLKGFDTSQLSSPNQMFFKGVVYAPSYNLNTGLISPGQLGPEVRESGVFTVNITGSLGGDLSGVRVSFNPAPPANSPYNSGTIIAAVINVPASSIQQLDPNGAIQNFNVVTTINCDPLQKNCSPVGTFNIDRSAFISSGGAYQNNIPITAGAGFINGQNTVYMTLYASGTGTKIGQGSGTLSAQGLNNPNNPPNPTNPNSPPNPTNPNNPPNPGSPNNTVYNPLPVDTLLAFAVKVIQVFLGIIGAFAVLFIMIGGFRMILAQGNDEALSVAKRTITWAVIGLVVAVLSFSIVTIVSNLLQANIRQSSMQQTENRWS